MLVAALNAFTVYLTSWRRGRRVDCAQGGSWRWPGTGAGGGMAANRRAAPQARSACQALAPPGPDEPGRQAAEHRVGEAPHRAALAAPAQPARAARAVVPPGPAVREAARPARAARAAAPRALLAHAAPARAARGAPARTPHAAAAPARMAHVARAPAPRAAARELAGRGQPAAHPPAVPLPAAADRAAPPAPRARAAEAALLAAARAATVTRAVRVTARPAAGPLRRAGTRTASAPKPGRDGSQPRAAQ